MSEKRRCSLCGASRMDNGACSLLGCRDPLFDQRAEEAIAAAEERGRRAGIEEAAKICAYVVNESKPWLAAWRAPPLEVVAQHIAEAIRNLAPHDSAPECGHLLSRDLGAEWRCGKPRGHDGPHSGAKP